MRNRFGVVVAASLVVVLLAGCSQSGSSKTASTESKSYSIALIEPNSLVPGKSMDGELPLAALFTPLVGLGSDGNLQYLQAESVEGRNNSKTWTVKIRSGWTFHNGEAVTAQSYVDAWNFNAYGPNAYATNWQLANIAGYAALNPAKGTPTTKALSGMKIIDQNTFEVTLSNSDGQFPFKLTANNWAFYPLPKVAYADLVAYDNTPIGDGPYQMAGAWKHDESIPMTAYPEYAGIDKAKTKNLTFKIYSDPETAYTDVLAGNTDVAAVPGSKMGQFKASFADRFFLRGGQNIEFLGFPLSNKKWQNIKLRQAISLAIDREAINKALFGGVYGNADSLFPQSLVGGNTHSCTFCTFDPIRAKALLAEAGGLTGTMKISYTGGYGLDQEYEALANQLRQSLGIKVVAEASATVSAFYANVDGGKYTEGPVYSSWGPYLTPNDILSPSFIPGGIMYTSTNYSNPSVTSLIAQGNATADVAKATKLFHQAEALVMADFPVIPLFFLSLPMVYSERVEHVSADALTNPVFTAITVK